MANADAAADGRALAKSLAVAIAQSKSNDRPYATNPPGNQSQKGPKANADAERDTSSKKDQAQNTAEQGVTVNIRQNTTNKSFFQGLRSKVERGLPIGSCAGSVRLLVQIGRRSP